MPSMTTIPKIIIFTDLDGTLLERETYSFEAAQPALRVIREKGIPLVLSSSKTRAEIEFYRRKLGNGHPFVSENGGAVFIPKDYFSFRFPYDRDTDGFFVLELGTFYPKIIEVLEWIKKETGILIKGFSDLTEKEISSMCGLNLKEAELARQREYDEPFIIEGSENEVDLVKERIREKGLNWVWGGRFHHILGSNDKGKAAEILKELFENEFFSISTIAIGDSLNDLPMLFAVDRPIFLKEKGIDLPEISWPIKNLIVLEGTGPQAWNEAILTFIK